MHIEIPNAAITSMYPDENTGHMQIFMDRIIPNNIHIPDADNVSVDENGTVTVSHVMHVHRDCTITVDADTTYIES